MRKKLSRRKRERDRGSRICSRSPKYCPSYLHLVVVRARDRDSEIIPKTLDPRAQHHLLPSYPQYYFSIRTIMYPASIKLPVFFRSTIYYCRRSLAIGTFRSYAWSPLIFSIEFASISLIYIIYKPMI